MVAGDTNLALLIDGDNVSSKIIGGLIAEVAKYGNASVRRIYGDWTAPNLKGWKECLLENSIHPMQQFAYKTGKNATDGAMIIDAMDLLYTNRFAGFCIVSSDSDFTRLASRIREQGVMVHGFGERKTNSAFIAACDTFTYFDVFTAHFDVFGAPAEAPAQVEAAPQIETTTQGEAMPPAIAPTSALRPKPDGPSASTTTTSTSPKKTIDDATLSDIARAVTSVRPYTDDSDWVNLADVGNHMLKLRRDLKPQNYGYERLWHFLKASGIVEVSWVDHKNAPAIALGRLKQVQIWT